MTDLAELGVRVSETGIEPTKKKLDDLAASSKKVEDQTKSTEKSSKSLGDTLKGEVSQGIEQSSNSMGIFGRVLSSLGPAGTAAAAGIGVITAALANGLREWSQYERIVLRVNAVLEAQGNNIQVTTNEVQALGAAIEQTSFNTEEDVLAAAAALASFGNTSKENFERTLRDAADLATVLGSDLTGAVVQLGKAFEDPVQGLTQLRRVGVQFSDTEKELIAQMNAAGNAAGVQEIILGKLEKRFGGAAEGEASGVAGAAFRAADAVGDFFRNIVQVTGIADAARAALDLIAGGFNAITPDLATDIEKNAQAIQFLKQRLEEAKAAVTSPGLSDQQRQGLGLEIARLSAQLSKLQAEAQAAASAAGNGVRGGGGFAGPVLTDNELQKQRDREAAVKEVNDALERQIALSRMQSDQAQIAAAGDAAVAQAKSKLVTLTKEEEAAVRALGEASARAQIARDKNEKSSADAARAAAKAAKEHLDNEERTEEAMRRAEITMEKRENSINTYIESLEAETLALKESETEREVQHALLRAEAMLYDDAGNKLRDLTDLEKERIRAAVEGAEATKDALDEEKKATEKAQEAQENLAQAISTAFEDAVTNGATLHDTFMALLEDIEKIILRATFTKPLENALGGFLSGGGGFFDSIFGGLFGSRLGNAFNFGSVVPMAAGGIIGGPTIAPMAMMGEAGPEAAMPLTRIGGKLGVAGTAPTVIVENIDQRGTQAPPPQTSQRQGPNGELIIRTIIRDEVKRGVDEGVFDKSFQRTFGVSRQPTAR